MHEREPMTAVRPLAGPDRTAERALQPMVHQLVVSVAAPTTVLSGADGQITHEGAQGLFHADVRALSRAEVWVDGRAPEPVADGPAGRGTHHFVSLLRHLGDRLPDPTVRLDRHRHLVPGRLGEVLRLTSTAGAEVTTRVQVVLAADFAGMEEVKLGMARMPVPPRRAGSTVLWGEGAVTVRLVELTPLPQVRIEPESVVLTWEITLAARTTVALHWTVEVTDVGAVVAAAPDTPWWPAPDVSADDRRLQQLLQQSVDDLYGLRMVTVSQPADVFVAAGSPWYLTFFGRDSLWAARMMLPLGTELAAGTLRTLAARQGTLVDPRSQEQPGKILHELRRDEVHLAAVPGLRLPAQYYGTVDATPLWLLLLHDAWRWGLPADEIEPLLGHAVRALDWVVGAGDPDGDGFLEYVDSSGFGLTNQGWKDSGDSVRFGDGRIAEAPIALCEVQGYAYEAARGGADLLEAFGRSGTDRYRAWAAVLKTRFREQFWVDDGAGGYPAIALDGAKVRVDSLTSNAGHLLGTGLLDDAETARVVRLLTDARMDSGYGLRTMSSAAGGYSPLSYHCGSVWPHDTAVVVTAMARSGYATEAAALIDGLLSAGAAFDGRVPELYSGEPRGHLLRPVPYPAACRPQAWSAAASVALLEATLGLRPDVPGGVLRVAPARPSPVGRLRVEGLRLGDESVTVEVDATGDVLEITGTGLRVEVAPPR